MIVSPQPPCHNRLKSLNSFSVSLLVICLRQDAPLRSWPAPLHLSTPKPLHTGAGDARNRAMNVRISRNIRRAGADADALYSSRGSDQVGRAKTEIPVTYKRTVVLGASERFVSFSLT